MIHFLAFLIVIAVNLWEAFVVLKTYQWFCQGPFDWYPLEYWHVLGLLVLAGLMQGNITNTKSAWNEFQDEDPGDAIRGSGIHAIGILIMFVFSYAAALLAGLV